MNIQAQLLVPDVLEDDSMMTLELRFNLYQSTTTEIAKGQLLAQYATFTSENQGNYTLGCAMEVGSGESHVALYWGDNTFDSASATVAGRDIWTANAEDMVTEPITWDPNARRRQLKRVPNQDHQRQMRAKKHRQMIGHLANKRKLEEILGRVLHAKAP